MRTRFRDRTEAGRLLANCLKVYAHRTDVWVFGLPRGGVPVAYEIAQTLQLPLDICSVRKLGVPEQPELAMGAIAPDGVRVLNSDVLNGLRIREQTLKRVTARESEELKRRDRLYRGDRPQPMIQGQTIILVDDGIATGATMRAAIARLKPEQPQQIIVAVPVASQYICRALSADVHHVTCLAIPELFDALGFWYESFPQTTDDEVRECLAQQDHLHHLVSTVPNSVV